MRTKCKKSPLGEQRGTNPNPEEPAMERSDLFSAENIRLLRWWAELKRTNNETFLPLFFDAHRYLVVMGGGGSGKSIFAGRKVLERCSTEAGHRWLVCRKVARTIRESCFRQLAGQAQELYSDSIAQIYRGDMRLTFTNGSEILFAGLDDVEKLKSIYNITGIWVEEASELLEGDFNQLDIRLRGETAYYKQIILTFNPISILHWLKKRFFDTPDERVRTHRSTYRDNRFLDEEAKAVLEAFRDSDPYYYAVYCLGEWGVLGKSVFDARAVAARLAELKPPVKVGYFTWDETGGGPGNPVLQNIRWVEDGVDGFIRIYRDVEAGRPYVVGGDTAGEGSDWFVGQALDNVTGEQAAVLRHRMDEDLYAKQMYCLGRYYNDALVGIETNYSTYPVMELERLRYPRQYVREVLDDFTHRVRQSFGFQTNSKTRNVILAGLIKAVREDVGAVNDRDTLEEMLTFVRNEAFRPEAEAGAHDDTVMALAIAQYIRPQQSYLLTAAPGEKAKWTADQWEDYRGASQEVKAYLISKWGNPF